MSETITLERKHKVTLTEPLGKRLGIESAFCKLCGDCIARMRPLNNAYGQQRALLDGGNGDIIALAEVQCTSFFNGGKSYSELTKGYTYRDGALEPTIDMMEKLENELPCSKFPDFITINE